MEHEIGSFYEIGGGQTASETSGGVELWPKESSKEVEQWPKEISGGVEQWLKEASGGREITLFCSGREAIDAVLEDLEQRGLVKKKTCLLPAYTCDTVILPFEKRGWHIRFFQTDQKLRPKQPEFRRLLEEDSPEVLLAHTYYGVDTLAEERTYIWEQKAKSGMLFVEDMTQSLARLAPENLADYYVGSLRKWFAVPDGGFAASFRGLGITAEGERQLFVEEKLAAQTLKYEYLRGTGQMDGTYGNGTGERPGQSVCEQPEYLLRYQTEKEIFLQRNARAERYLYEDDRICSISRFSKKRLARTDALLNFRKRKENALYLWNAISRLRKVRPVLNVAGNSPLYVPVYTEKREELQEFLKENQIFAPVLWPVPDQVQGKTEAETEYIFRKLLALPCDQRYGQKEMERIGRCLLEYDRE